MTKFQDEIFEEQREHFKNKYPDIYQYKAVVDGHLNTISRILDTLENTRMGDYSDEYLRDLKEKILSLKDSFASFKKSTYSGAAAPSMSGSKLDFLKNWLADYDAGQFGGGMEKDINAKTKKKNIGFDVSKLEPLANDARRIVKIIEESLPSTFENIKQRVEPLLKEGLSFVKKLDSFLLTEDDIEFDILMLDDEDEPEELNFDLVEPTKTIASISKIISVYKIFLKKVNEKLQNIISLLTYLESQDLKEIFSIVNSRNKLLIKIFESFGAITKTILHMPKIKSPVVYNKIIDEYKEYVNRAAQFLPQELYDKLIRTVNLAKMKQISEESLEKHRESPEKLMSRMSSQKFSLTDRFLLDQQLNR